MAKATRKKGACQSVDQQPALTSARVHSIAGPIRIGRKPPEKDASVVIGPEPTTVTRDQLGDELFDAVLAHKFVKSEPA